MCIDIYIHIHIFLAVFTFKAHQLAVGEPAAQGKRVVLASSRSRIGTEDPQLHQGSLESMNSSRAAEGGAASREAAKAAAAREAHSKRCSNLKYASIDPPTNFSKILFASVP